MRAQIMLSMLLMLAVSTAFVLSLAALFMGIVRIHAIGAGRLGSYLADSDNALARSALPYSEFT